MTRRYLAKMELEAFLKEGFDSCPKCKSIEYMSWDSLECEAEYAWQNFRCSGCNIDGSVFYKIELIEITQTIMNKETPVLTNSLDDKLKQLEIWPEDLKPEFEKQYKDFYKGELPYGPIAILELPNEEESEYESET